MRTYHHTLTRMETNKVHHLKECEESLARAGLYLECSYDYRPELDLEIDHNRRMHNNFARLAQAHRELAAEYSMAIGILLTREAEAIEAQSKKDAGESTSAVKEEATDVAT